MQLDHAVVMVQATSEVLFDRPGGFHCLLDEISAGGRSAASGNKLSAHFGRFYHTLYKSFPEATFGFLHDGFESYIGRNWTGQLAKRNRRFSPESRDLHEWISVKEAAKILHIRTTKVKELVEKGELVGRFFPTSSGRRMGSILKDSVTAAVGRHAKLLTLVEVRRTHGLSRKRLYKLIADGLLRAVSGPPVDGHPVWQFEEAALEEAIRLVEHSENGGAQQKENERP
ncbi:helix-turn-helix domain-containing protein [Cupriavidus sp. HMR-1]|uniref:helix-turn-helix domain-containing protein n=1 Tax=Cupriavidus sp. HMR-1 TaxID=1249621 RepID=UPI001F495F95|nr:helix-turn-helix domain-containing protein [Cupriavidus sp. HMR-1]